MVLEILLLISEIITAGQGILWCPVQFVLTVFSCDVI